MTIVYYKMHKWATKFLIFLSKFTRFSQIVIQLVDLSSLCIFYLQKSTEIVDNVDNFVYNSNISIFQPFQDVDNFYTIFRVIHIFPHYSTRFVQFAICSILFDFFLQNKRATVLQIA